MSGDAPKPPGLLEALRAYGFSEAGAERVPGGLINVTFRVADERGEPLAALQRLHPVFAPEVNLDIDAITAHLAARGMETPRLLRTESHERWVETEDGVWRALSWLEGTTHHRLEDTGHAKAAGELVGRFHRELADLEHEFAFARAGVHDTPAHLARLRTALEESSGAGDRITGDARSVGREILAAADNLPPLGDLPQRICHGDLKVSNVLFAAPDAGGRARARCLIDLDTLGRQTVAYELGDAFRSWCNPAGEDAGAAAIDRDLFAAALRGYARGAEGILGKEELASIVPGLETICVELSARFLRDVFDDAYFGWDPARFSSRREHNLVRARGQLALARSVRADRAELERLLHASF